MPPKSETSKSTARKTDQANGVNALFPTPVNFVELQMRNLAMLARANQIFIDTTKAVWENETELFKLEAEQARKSLTPVKTGDNLAVAYSNFCSQWHENSEKTIGHLRAIGDQMRNCEWQLLSLVTESLSAAGQHPAAD